MVEQILKEQIICPAIGNSFVPDLQVRALADYRTPTLKEDLISIAVFEAESQANSE